MLAFGVRMSAWFFLQRRDQRESDFQDELIIKEHNRYQATLNQLLKYRKARLESALTQATGVHDKQRNEMPNSDSKSVT
jgi:hypothetical protein